MSDKLKVMLHYSDFGTQRSPNDQFDLLRKSQILSDACEFIILNQSGLPRIKGHLKTIIELYKKIKSGKPDVIHIVGVKEGFHCVIAAFLAGCKKRILITRGFAGYSAEVGGIKQFVYRWMLEPFTIMLSTYVHCNSFHSYNTPMIRIFAKNKRTVIYNFLNFPGYTKEHEWRNKNHIKEDDFLICTIGNMHYGKGYDILQKVIDYYRDNGNVKFVIIGKGVVKEEFDRTNRNNRNVYSLGALPHAEAIQILSECNLFYLPTRFETLGMVFAEAGACGIPSVGSDVGAVKEIIRDGETGYLILKDDYQAAIDKINILLNNNQLCKMMGEKAQEFIGQQFSSDIISRQILFIYQN